MTRRRHLAAVEALEAAADEVVLGALAGVLAGLSRTFAAITAAVSEPPPPGEPAASLDDLTRIQPEWAIAVDGEILPWYQNVFMQGADSIAETIAEQRLVDVEVLTGGDPLMLQREATRHLATARDRFLDIGADTWEAARTSMLEGFATGEGVEPLQRRVREVVDTTRARASAIARTEVISASNAGATARVRSMGDDAPPNKQWVATNDGRTRPTHRAADNQVVPRDDPFLVGGVPLDYPGDPAGPDGEVINCRCTLLFIDGDEPERLDDDLLADIEAEMAAEIAAGRDAARQALAAAAVLPEPNGPEQVDTTTGETHTGSMIALLPSVNDAEHLALDGGEPLEQIHLTLWFLGDADEIPVELQEAIRAETEARAETIEALTLTPGAFGAAVWNPDADACVVYNVGGGGLTGARDEFGQGLINAPDNVESNQVAAKGWRLPDQHVPWSAHVCAAYGGDPAVQLPQMIERLGPVTFDRVRLTFGGDVFDYPLAESADLSELVAATEVTAMPWKVQPGGDDCPFQVVRSDTGEPVDGGCHPTAEEAEAHVRALYAAEGSDDDAAIDAEAEGLAPLPGEHFHAVMHTQGKSTGMRTFTNLGWRSPPFAFHWQRGSSAHGGLPEVLQAGLNTRVIADPDNPDVLHAFGVLDLGSDVGMEYARQLVTGFARWVSIGLDETPYTETIIWPEGLDLDDPMAMMTARPEQVIIDGGRIAELSGVSTPAQDDATIEPTAELVAMFGDAEPTQAPPAILSVASRITPATPLQLTPASAAPTDADVEALVASAYRIEVREAPPAAWFERPDDVDISSAFAVSDHGRVYGLLAPLGVNHRAYAKAGRRREVPFGNVDYEKFMGAKAITASGLVAAGPLTMDCGHAPRNRPNHDVAPAHYENSCSVVGAVAVGEARELGGVWMAGALLPGVTVEQLSRMLTCRCSGDWQPHADRAGWVELVACLLVPSPGYATGHRAGASMTFDQDDILVASSVPVTLADHPAPSSSTPSLAGAMDRILSTVGQGRRQRVAAAVDHVTGRS